MPRARRGKSCNKVVHCRNNHQYLRLNPGHMSCAQVSVVRLKLPCAVNRDDLDNSYRSSNNDLFNMAPKMRENLTDSSHPLERMARYPKSMHTAVIVSAAPYVASSSDFVIAIGRRRVIACCFQRRGCGVCSYRELVVKQTHADVLH